MIDDNASQERLQVEIGQFLLAIQTIRTVDKAAFQKIYREASELARALKVEPLVPKSLLNELSVAAKVLRAEAPYMAHERNDLEAMADKLEMILDLILKGEAPEDRKPGVPRIV